MRTLCITLAAIWTTTVTFAADMPETKKEAAAATAQTKEATPLHRHPTLLAMLRRSNLIRRNVGLRAQRINPALTKAAQDHANYMASTGDFQHYSNGGPQYRANKYGFKGGVLENIAYNYRSVDDAFNTWQASGGHYASIISNTSECGFGYAVSKSGATYWVGVYANPAAGDVTGEEEGFAEKAAAEKVAEGDEKAQPTKEAQRAANPAATGQGS